jgi:hypothetical protein
MSLLPTLTDNTTRDALVARVLALRPDATRQWGKMHVHQMLWHVAEAYRVALGDVTARDQSSWISRTLIRGFAFYAPFPWPRNGPTLPPFDAVRQRPSLDTAFDELRGTVSALIARMAASKLDGVVHPFFGPLSQAEWQHWGWRHCDHHLRQFGG